MNNMDKLDYIFKMQEDLQKRLGYNYKEFNNNYFNLMFIGAITELCEMLEKTKWKPWKKSANNDITEIQKEIIDAWHFLINLSIHAGMSSDYLFNMYINKNNINHERQKNGY
jgi:dimeric dUTPase (all-alpha-NTP-PPase superfamily)